MTNPELRTACCFLSADYADTVEYLDNHAEGLELEALLGNPAHTERLNQAAHLLRSASELLQPLIATALATRTDINGLNVSELPGLWSEDDITATCPHCDGGLTEANVDRGHCPHCAENL
ncbi:MAG: hypothetical protein EA368_12385 [Leptolyngbya sp. DLM2.Bin27]|nr:MAG: hypothetical protein EA368_12385 [Leptolyngbya sp. DLM2.Bin27]